MQDKQGLQFDHRARRNIKMKGSSPVAIQESMNEEDTRNLDKSPDFATPEINIQDEAQTRTAVKKDLTISQMASVEMSKSKTVEKRAYSQVRSQIQQRL